MRIVLLFGSGFNQAHESLFLAGNDCLYSLDNKKYQSDSKRDNVIRKRVDINDFEQMSELFKEIVALNPQKVTVIDSIHFAGKQVQISQFCEGLSQNEINNEYVHFISPLMANSTVKYKDINRVKFIENLVFQLCLNNIEPNESLKIISYSRLIFHLIINSISILIDNTYRYSICTVY
ncbi:MAG: hypothetical protein EP298_00915, partial [Gammaproteobacteria bacterium]